MAQESRVHKVILNAKVNMIFYFIILIISFFSRKVFLDCLGTAFLGFTGALSNLLGFLNLAELGVGSAIGYLLYKPLFDQDRDKINEIISVMGYLYRCIGLIILIGGVILSFFLPFIFPKSDTGFSYALVYFAFYSFLISSLLSYFINYRQILLGADQRSYVVTAYYQGSFIIKYIAQILLAYYTKSLYLWIAIELSFSIIYSFILNWRIDKTYPWLKSEIRQGRKMLKKYPEVLQKTKQLFIHKMGAFVQFQTAPFLIYAFVSLSEVALYQNYTTVTSKLSSFFGNLTGTIGASVGNLIAEGDKSKIQRIYWELMSSRVYIASLICIPLYFLIDPFICLWLGDGYLLSNYVLALILINVFISIVRSVNEDFAFGNGLFWDVWAPFVEIFINLTVAIIGGYYLGLPGVLLGGVISLAIIVCGWKPYMLFHWGFKLSIFRYIKGMFINHLAIAIAFITTYYIAYLWSYPSYESWIKWIIYSVSITLISASLSFIFLYVLAQGMRDFTKRFIDLISKKLRLSKHK